MLAVLSEYRKRDCKRARYFRGSNGARAKPLGCLQARCGNWLRDPLRVDICRGRFRMRLEFRFPRATATLMTIMVAAVVLTIEQARAIVSHCHA